MISIRNFVLGLAAAALISGTHSAFAADTLNDKVHLQATMQQYIDAQSVDGRYLALDEKSGAVRALYPKTAHSMIMRMGEHFVLCFDFQDDQGKDANIDFYMARKDDSFVVFHAAIDDRDVLNSLMKDGKVSRME